MYQTLSLLFLVIIVIAVFIIYFLKRESMVLANELPLMNQTSARDILNDLGPISKEEVDYYKNL